MARNIDDLIAELPEDHQQEIEERFQAMNAEYMALQELRRAMKFTQMDIAKKLKMDQGNISKLESRTDLMLSTLRRYIESMGGSLKLVAEFPRRPPVEVIGFSNSSETKNL
ncbi:putative transcriptional regulator [Desulfamplus magnetovallimortis]|uniref:Putative transcriptional regulator n=1 Tax=Desulfamplus magnetovallimortis TaxID=1246637 RepID=A0A1W1HF88_9BACT|nr:XRE family transcriptional regulator [Desulfamplus magnetovallimortis]SLM31147.1 putative transcriptional regulator [Desulfamplus magnetovallimortis]